MSPAGPRNIMRTCGLTYPLLVGAKRVKILLWLSDIPFHDHHKFSREHRHKETGNWLLQHDKFWKWRNSSGSSMLWLRGNGGYYALIH